MVLKKPNNNSFGSDLNNSLVLNGQSRNVKKSVTENSAIEIRDKSLPNDYKIGG